MIDLRAQLFLVYNANSGLIDAISHTVHRFCSPKTYPCSLCALTHGRVAMRRDWKQFLNSLEVDVEFYHSDDFTAAYPRLGTGGEAEVRLPAILFAPVGREPSTLIGSDELDKLADLSELIAMVRERLSRGQRRRSVRA